MSNIYIYSRGKFKELPLEFMNGKAIINVYNITDRDWEELENADHLIKLYFNDIKSFQLQWFEKIMIYFPLFNFNQNNAIFSKNDAMVLIKFIEQNKSLDFIINCEYGRSRSVAISLFIKERYNCNIINKTKEECSGFNDWVYMLLKKYNNG